MKLLWLEFLRWLHIRRLRKQYNLHESIADRYDCGISLAYEISPTLCRVKSKLDATLNTLREIDARIEAEDER